MFSAEIVKCIKYTIATLSFNFASQANRMQIPGRVLLPLSIHSRRKFSVQ